MLLRSSTEKAEGRVVGYNVGTTALQQPFDLPVRPLPVEALYQLTSTDPKEQQRFTKEYGQVPEQWRGVLVDVARAAHEIAQGTREEAQRIIREHLQDQSVAHLPASIPPTIRQRPRPLAEADDFKRLAAANPADWLVRMLSDGLRKPEEAVRFVLWWNHKANCLSNGLLCPDARTAAFTLLLGTVGHPSGLAVCARCGNPFQALRGQQRYCSSRCQTAAAMARYRSRLAERGKGKSRSRKRRRTKQ